MSDLDLLLAAADVDDEPIAPTPVSTAAVPSPYQERLWRAHLAAPGTAYTVPCVFDLDGVESDRVVRAATAVLSREEVFASRIVGTADSGFKLVPAGTIVPDIAYVSDVDTATDALLKQPWNAGPLVRLSVLRCSGRPDRIVLVFHHAVVDGHSVSLLIAEISRELTGLGRVPNGPRYHDVARVRPESASWWRTYLSEVPYRTVWRPSAIAAPVVSRGGIGDVSTGADSAMWLTAVVASLSRMLSVRTFCIRVPLANRRTVEEFDVIGPLVSTVPLVFAVSELDTVGDLHDHVRRTLEGAIANADADLSALVSERRREDPDFWLPADIFVNIQTVDRSEIALDGGTARPIAAHTGELKSALTVSISATRRPEIQIESAIPGWSEVTHSGLRDVLESVLRAGPSSVVGNIGLHRGRLGRSRTEDSSIVAALLSGSGSAAALTAPDRDLTRGELSVEIKSCAAVLVDHGVCAGDSVLLSVERDAAFVTWAAAIMALGAAFVPVDTAQGAARIASIAAQSNAQVAVLADVESAPPRSTVIDRSAARSSTNTVVLQHDSSLIAYVVFTSGTTGVPKGVPVTHANLLALRQATEDLIGPDDVVSAVHAFTFDFSVWEIWTALSRGARVVLYAEPIVRDPFVLAEQLAVDRVTVLSMTDTALGSLLTAEPNLPSVRRVVLGGEQVSAAYVRRWVELNGRSDVVNMLGATETTVHTTWRRVRDGDLHDRTVQVGAPLRHLDVVVVDADGRALPRGVTGQIAVRGTGLALGYLGQGALTAARFVPDSFPGAFPGGRLYLTGDLGRWLAPDELFFIGRVDSQVKVRGHRIEAAGVETVLESIPGVHRACVVAQNNRLLAFVESAITVPDLRSAVATRLATYEVPDDFYTVSGFPVTVNGKLDRRVDKLLAAAGVRALPLPSEPHTTLTDVLAATLTDRSIDSTATFLANGGDSILAVRVVADLRAAGTDIGVGDVLGATSIAALEDTIAERAPISTPDALVLEPFALIDRSVREALPVDVSDAYPLSAAQEGMLFHIRSDDVVGVYHNTTSIRIRGGFDPLAFRVALADTVRRHEVLRTSIDEWTAPVPLQLVHRHVSAPLAVVNIAPSDDVDAVIDAIVERERSTPFDLERAPLFRLTLIRVAPREDQLIITDSHLILDGWSWTSTLAEIVERHNSLCAHDPKYDSTLVPTEVRFADFIAAEMNTRSSRRAADNWAEHLKGVRPLSISDVRTGGARAVTRSEIEVASLADVAQTAGISLRHLAMALHVRAMADVFGLERVVTGVTANGRPEVRGGIDARGMFLNMIPLLLPVVDGDPVKTARECARIDAAMAPYRRMPNVDITMAAGKGPLFDFGFNFVKFHRLMEIEKTHTFGSKYSDSHFAQENTDFALMATFSVHPPEHRLSLMLIADTARVSRARHDRLLEAYRAAAAWAMCGPGHPVVTGEENL